MGSQSGETSAMKPSILGMILDLPVLLYPRTAAMPWIFQQGSPCTDCERTGKTCPMKLLCWLKSGRVYGQSLSPKQWSAVLVPRQAKMFFLS